MVKPIIDLLKLFSFFCNFYGYQELILNIVLLILSNVFKIESVIKLTKTLVRGVLFIDM